jgi:hypothetical protein
MEAVVFTLNAPQLGRAIASDRLREAERRRTHSERVHRQQRERVRASLLMRPEARSAGQSGA